MYNRNCIGELKGLRDIYLFKSDQYRKEAKRKRATSIQD